MLRRMLLLPRLLGPLMALALLGTACEGAAQAAPPAGNAVVQPAAKAAAKAAATVTPGATARADAAPATLGPLPARYQPDVMVQAPDGMDQGTVAKLVALVGPGRAAVLRTGSIQAGSAGSPGAVSVAGVDPAAFRSLAPQGTAEMTAVWDAVNRGEAAVSYAAARRLGISLGGSFQLAPTPGAVTLRAGA